MRTRLAWLPLLLALPLMGADPKWIRVPSPGFEIYSSANEGDTRRVLRYFELASDFFAKATGAVPAKTEPVRVIVFGSKKEYLPYRPNEFAVAFYQGGAARDYIVLGGTTDDVFPIAVHEYAHLIGQNSGTRLPPWLNEGLAELYSTIRPLGDQVVVGSLIPGRMQALRREKWTPLSVILAADRNSPYYNEKNKAGSLYNEGWALTHMLALTTEYAANFTKLVAAIGSERPSQQALEEAYGKPLAQIERDLQGYINGGSFQGAVIPAKLRGSSGRAASSALGAFDLKLALLDLTNRPGREEETRKAYEALEAEDPARPEPHVGLGYLAWRLHDDQGRAGHFGKAFELGARNPTFLFDYGRTSAQADPKGAAKALETLMAAQPNRKEVRIALAEALLIGKDAMGARATLAKIGTVTPDDAGRFFKILAYASLETGDLKEARAAGKRWKEFAKEEGEKEAADGLLDAVDNRERFMDGSARGDAGNSGSAGANKDLASFSGTLIDMQCKGSESRLVVENRGEKMVLLMADSSTVSARLKGGNVVDLTCGKQKPVEVTIRYDPAAAQSEIAGQARIMEFRDRPEAVPESAQPSTSMTVSKLPARPYVAGMMVNLDCSSIPPRIILLLPTGKERVPFLVDSVDLLLVYGLPDGKGMEMSCGPVKPEAVWIEYDMPSAAQRGVRGLARAIHFEPVPATTLKTR